MATEQVLGTLDNMAPERIRGERAAGAATSTRSRACSTSA